MTRLIDADALLEEIQKMLVERALGNSDETIYDVVKRAPTIQREVPDELPKLGGGIYKHENLGELYDRLQVHQYAVNHCETIAAMLSNKNTVQREGWVSVDDRLPEKDGEVLVCAETDDGQYITSMRFDGKDFWHEGEKTYCHSYYCSPTHWQLLPAAPTDKE